MRERPFYTAIMVFVEVLFPILAIAAIGYGLGRSGHLPGEGLSKLTFWILSPALIFTALYRSEIELRAFLDYGLFIAIFSLFLWGIALVLGRARRLPPETTAALALSLVFTNAGNYGLPLLLFAYGEQGFALGVVYLSISTFLMSTLGVVISTWGGRWSWRPFLNIFLTPLFYAVVLAVLFKILGIELPLPVMRPLELLTEAAIPMLLMMLGTQLVGAHLGGRRSLIGLATLIRLGVAPSVAWGLSGLIGLDGLAHAVAVIESSMPTAVNAVVLATYYRCDPRLVSSVVLVTTLLSVGTIGVLLLFLRG